MCKLHDYILREFRENIDKDTALCSSAHLTLSKVLLCNKTGVCRSISYFSYLCSKHGL